MSSPWREFFKFNIGHLGILVSLIAGGTWNWTKMVAQVDSINQASQEHHKQTAEEIRIFEDNQAKEDDAIKDRIKKLEDDRESLRDTMERIKDTITDVKLSNNDLKSTTAAIQASLTDVKRDVRQIITANGIRPMGEPSRP